MRKNIIKNRKNKNLVVIVEKVEKSKWLVFIMHGLWWNKEQAHIELFAKVFSDNLFSVVRFDTTCTYGESDWKFEDATIGQYYNDLEDVIDWASKQDWYKEKFVLVWHSLWWISTAMFTEIYPEKIKGLAPISSVIEWDKLLEVKWKNKLIDWKKSWIIKYFWSSGTIKRLKYSFVEDILLRKYNLFDAVDQLKMPVLMIVWELDESIPPKYQEVFYDRIPWKKEFYVIKNAPHTFKRKVELDEIYMIFDRRIKFLV